GSLSFAHTCLLLRASPCLRVSHFFSLCFKLFSEGPKECKSQNQTGHFSHNCPDEKVEVSGLHVCAACIFHMISVKGSIAFSLSSRHTPVELRNTTISESDKRKQG